MNKGKKCETVINRLFGIFFSFFYLTLIIGSVVSTSVIGNGFPTLDKNLNTTAADGIISKCGINQVDIEKSCADGEIDDRTRYMLMGIFR